MFQACQVPDGVAASQSLIDPKTKRDDLAAIRADIDDLREVTSQLIEAWGESNRLTAQHLMTICAAASNSSQSLTNNFVSSIEVVGTAFRGLAACAARPANEPNDDWAAAALAVGLNEAMTRTPGFTSFTEDEGDMLGLNKMGPWVEIATVAYPYVAIVRRKWLEMGNTTFFASESDEHVGTVRATVALVLAARRLVTRFTAGAGINDSAGPEVGQ